MAKLKNPEINSILFDKEENEKLDTEQEREAYIEAQEEYENELKRQKEEEYEQKVSAIQEKNQTILSIDPNYDEKLEGGRRSVFYDDHRNVDDEHYINVYEERPEDAYVGELTDTVYSDGSSSTYWGATTDIPAHWSNKQAEDFLEMRANGYKISEKLFDKYAKSEAKDIDAFLHIEKIRAKVVSSVEKSQEPTNNSPSVASIAKIKQFKQEESRRR